MHLHLCHSDSAQHHMSSRSLLGILSAGGGDKGTRCLCTWMTVLVLRQLIMKHFICRHWLEIDIIDAGFLLSEKSRFKPSQSGRFRPEVIDNFVLARSKGMFASGNCKWNLFSSDVPHCDVLVVHMCACGKHH